MTPCTSRRSVDQNHAEPPDVGFNTFHVARESRTLFTQDILYRKTKAPKAENYGLKIDDIEHSCPKKLHQPLNKPYYYLRDDDIEGTKPAIAMFKTKREPSNPLNPVYKLASFEPLEPVVPRFIRDSINVDDIVGTRPKSLHQIQRGQRVTNEVKDIDGARPKKEYHVGQNDIRERKSSVRWKSKTSMNSVCSVPQGLPTLWSLTMWYLQRRRGKIDSCSQHSVIGFIDGSKSKVLHRNLPHGVPDHTGSLLNTDIDGSKTGTVGNKYIKTLVFLAYSAKKPVQTPDQYPGHRGCTAKQFEKGNSNKEVH